MCGLVGVINPALVFNGEQYFKNALVADTVRGPHSTGIFAVDNNGKCTYAKRAMTGAEFVYENRDILRKVIGDPYKDNVRAMIGHNRYATQGAVNAQNAHPFAHGYITMVHNGTLRGNYKNLAPGKNFGTDSEHIAYALSQSDDPYGIDVLEKLEGAFALIWHDAELNTLNIARNSERKLYLARTTGKNGILIASEGGMIKWLADRERGKISIDEPQLVPANTVLRFDLDQKTGTKLIKPAIKEFTPKKYTPVQQAGGWRGKKSSGNAGQTTKSTSAQESGRAAGDHCNKAFVNRWCEQWLKNKPGDLSAFFAVELEKSNACKDSERHIIGDLLEWDTGRLSVLHKAYEGSDPETFHVTAKAHFYDFSKFTYKELESIVYVNADVSSVAVDWGSNGKDSAHVAEGMNVMLNRHTIEFFDADFNEVKPGGGKSEKKSKGGSPAGAAASAQQSLLPAPEDDDEQESSELLRGPGNLYVPPATWSALTSGGCAHCSQPIARMDHELVEWTRNSHGVQVPICHHCIDDVRQFAPQLLH